ncbi:MAG: hemin transporter HemP [Methylomonas sp.]|nr:MAG: hemin transporter HemP [Methylomonas sp.]
MNNSRPTTPVAGISSAESTRSKRKFTSKQLFDTHHEIVIEHNGEEYRLRITSNGKLILTK